MGKTKGKTLKAFSIRITEIARQNLVEITGYIAYIKHQPLNAIRVGDKIFETIELIGKNPFAYPECQEIHTKNKIYRKAVCYKWLIIYKIKPTEVLILGIIHSSRKPSRIKVLK